MNTEAILKQIDNIVAQMDDINAALKQILEDDNAN